MPYAMYLRKSRADAEAEARGEGETLERHRATLYALAARLSISVDCVYREIVSGDTIQDRPEMRRLLNDVSAGLYDGVLVMEVERLARGDTIDQGIVAQTFRYSNTRILTPAKTYDPQDEMDEEYFEFALFMSRREYKTIKRRLQAGRVASVRDGRYMGTRDPFGYRRVKLHGQKGWTLEIIPDQAEVVRMVFELYSCGIDGPPIGSALIADRLNRMGVPTYGGAEWTSGGVRQMLRNPVYNGQVQWFQRETVKHIKDGAPVKRRDLSDKHIVCKGLHDPIVDPATWSLVQAQFRTHARPAVPSALIIANPLAGIVKCGICGHAMVRRTGSSGTPDFLACSKRGCATTSIELSTVVSSVLSILEGWTAGYAVHGREASKARPDAPDLSSIVAQIHKRLQQLSAQKSRLHDLLEQGVYTIEEYVTRKSELTARIAEAEKELTDISRIPLSREDAIRRVTPRASQVLELYSTTTDVAQKNDLLKSVIEKVVYYKTKRCYRGMDSAQFLELDIFPRIDFENTGNML